jgi:polysaccharide biosynthesis protein PslH
MKLLYIAHSCPYPPNKGDRIRSFNLLRHLAQCHEVDLVYPLFSPSDSVHEEHLRKYAVSIETVRMYPWLAKLRSLFGLVTPFPLTVWYFYSKKLQQIIAAKDYDIVFVDCSSMAQYVVDVPKPKIIDFVDIDSEKWLLYAKKARFPKSLVYQIEHKKLSRYEDQLSAVFEHCLVTTEREKELIHNNRHVVVIGNGIDMDYFVPQKPSLSHTLVFSGVMNYFPNVDGVLYFHKFILPLIQKEIHDVKFMVAGMQPTQQIKALADETTLVTGYVPDIREYFANAAVCVVPLRIAKGVQNKILEAMAMGIPVVTTSMANSGIHATHQQEIMIADHPQAFSQAVVTLLKNPDLREEIAARARKLLYERFSWTENLRQLDTILAEVMAAG